MGTVWRNGFAALAAAAIATACGSQPGGSNDAVASGSLKSPAAARMGSWGPLQMWPISAAHANLLPDGNVLFWGDHDDGATPALWVPATGAIAQVTPPGWNLFCAGHTLLGNGTLLVAGGHLDEQTGAPDAGTFDPWTGVWTRLPDMNAGRWYPTATVLPNGQAVVVSGMVTSETDLNLIPQVLDPATRTWRDLDGASRSVPHYPRQFAAPDGRLFVVGPDLESLWLDLADDGSWTVGPSSSGERHEGNAVLIDTRVLIMAGGDPPIATAETIDLADPDMWSQVASMHFPRRYANATILPDGTVLVTGGSGGPGFDNDTAPVLAAELYDPAKNTWTTLASMSEYRGYHSLALLLPDGRVLSAGGGPERPESKTAQIFSPPYLFKGPRPVIDSAPGTIQAGSTFTVTTSHARNIKRVALIRLGSVTHAFDMSQRYVTLSFERGSRSLKAYAPSLDFAPPGHYMLFIVNASGVPSVARIVKLGE